MGLDYLILTPRAFALLELLMAHARQVCSREQMLNRVWGYDWVGDTNGVEVHIAAHHSTRWLRLEAAFAAQRRFVASIGVSSFILRS